MTGKGANSVGMAIVINDSIFLSIWPIFLLATRCCYIELERSSVGIGQRLEVRLIDIYISFKFIHHCHCLFSFSSPCLEEFRFCASNSSETELTQ